jgi:hypothetical protein
MDSLGRERTSCERYSDLERGKAVSVVLWLQRETARADGGYSQQERIHERLRRKRIATPQACVFRPDERFPLGVLSYQR